MLFAPHVGISESGELGKYSRIGRAIDDSACGAACGAFKYCLDCNSGVNLDKLDPDDYQMNYIKLELSKRLEAIRCKTTSDEQIAELSHQMYNICKVAFS